MTALPIDQGPRCCSTVFIVHDGTGRLMYGLEITEPRAVELEQARRAEWRKPFALDALRSQPHGLPVIVSTDGRRFAWAFDELPIIELAPEEYPGADREREAAAPAECEQLELVPARSERDLSEKGQATP